MGNKTIKLVANLTFDENKEQDIIEMIEYLNSHHKTGAFISGLIKLAMDCPEIIMKNTNGEIDLGPSMRRITVDGLSTLRKDFLNKLNLKVDNLWVQVGEIRKMALQVYTLAQMNKFIGIEGKSENSLRASFVIERQLSDLQRSLGTLINDKQFIDEKLAKSKDFADETLDYILSTYDGIVSEIKNQFNAVNSMALNMQVASQTQHAQTQGENKLINKSDVTPQICEVTKELDNTDVDARVESSETKPATESNKPAPVVNTVDTSDDAEDAIIDFGSDPEDFDILSNFFGD